MRYFTLIMLLLLGISVQAADYRAGESVQIALGDTIAEDLLAGSRSVDVDGVVLGDVYAGAQNVRIGTESRIGDDVLASGEEVQVYGPVGGNVIVFAGRVFINSEIKGDVLAYGGQVHLGSKAVVHGGIFIGTGQFELDGATVGGDINGGAGKATLNGIVDGKVDLGLGTVSFGTQYAAKGGTKLELNEEIAKDQIENAPADLELTYAEKHYFFTRTFFLWGLISFLISGILFVALFKDTARDLVQFANRELLKTSGMGLVYLIIIPVAVLILAILIFTIPVALIGGALYFILIYIGQIITALVVGTYLLKQIRPEFNNGRMFIPLIIGIILVVFLPEVPFIGWLIELAFICLGLGTLVLYGWQNFKPAKAA